MRMLKGPVHPTNTAGVWEKKFTVIQKNWRCLALKVSVVTLDILKFIPGSVLVAISWMISKSRQHGELQEIKISLPVSSGQICRWLLHFSSSSITSAPPSQCEGSSGLIVSCSDYLVLLYSYESKNCSSAGGEGAWMTNKLLVLVLKAGSDKNHCVIFVFPIASHQQEMCLSDSMLFEKNFKVHSQCCLTGMWAEKEKMPSLLMLSPVTLEWNCFRLNIELSGILCSMK